MSNWSDKPTADDAAINAAHPANSGNHKRYQIAMDMVGARHSKGALVEMTNWLLSEIERLVAENKALKADRRLEGNVTESALARMNEAEKKAKAFDAAQAGIAAAKAGYENDLRNALPGSSYGIQRAIDVLSNVETIFEVALE